MTKLEHLTEDLANKKTLLSQKITEVRSGAEDDGTDVADVKAGMDEVKNLKADIEGLQEQIGMVSEALEIYLKMTQKKLRSLKKSQKQHLKQTKTSNETRTSQKYQMTLKFQMQMYPMKKLIKALTKIKTRKRSAQQKI